MTKSRLGLVIFKASQSAVSERMAESIQSVVTSRIGRSALGISYRKLELIQVIQANIDQISSPRIMTAFAWIFRGAFKVGFAFKFVNHQYR